MKKPLKRDTVRAVRQSIAHWERMRAWARGQAPGKDFNVHTMKTHLGETTSSSSCSLCNISFAAGCKHCPLADREEPDGTSCCCLDRESPYARVKTSETNSDFVATSHDMVETLRDCLQDLTGERE